LQAVSLHADILVQAILAAEAAALALINLAAAGLVLLAQAELAV